MTQNKHAENLRSVAKRIWQKHLGVYATQWALDCRAAADEIERLEHVARGTDAFVGCLKRELDEERLRFQRQVARTTEATAMARQAADIGEHYIKEATRLVAELAEAAKGNQ